MSTIIVDAVMRETILAGGQVEIRDENGTLLGYLTRPGGLVSIPDGTVLEVMLPSLEELDRRATEGKFYTTEQVLEHLRKVREGLK